MPLDEKLMDRVFSSPQLPSLPMIALQIIEMVQEDEVDVDKIAETISLDPALSSKLLKTVNSSFYGLPKTVGSVHQAVVVLGLNSVKTLALGFSLVNNLTGTGGDGFDHMAFWRRSLYCATAAKQLCEQLNIVQAEEIFMSSLLQDVGVLAMAQVLGESYGQLMAKTAGDHRQLSKQEKESLGGDHTEVGGALAESWGLPPLLVESIRLHEHPDDAPENLRPLIRTVAAGAFAAELIENPMDNERVSEYHRVLSEWFDLDHAAAQDLLEQVFKQAKETQRLFDLPTGELGDPADIMAKARQALERVNEPSDTPTPPVKNQAAPVPAAVVEPAPSPAEPVAKPVSASDAAKGDTLTGLPTRRQFDEKLDELFLAAGPAQPLSIVYIDIDQFDVINEQVGRTGGDAVLRAVGAMLKQTIGQSGEAYRYDEDDFTMLCPGVNRPAAAMLAEKLRANIEAMAINVEGGAAVTLTASIGVACFEGTAFKRSEQLVKAASKGVFAAKDGGRNVVRVFVPRQAA